MLKSGSGLRARVLAALCIVMCAGALVVPAGAAAGDAEAWWNNYNGPYDVISHPQYTAAGCFSRQALMDNLWRYRYVGADENFVWYSDVIRIAANSGYNWASRAWSSGCWSDGSYYFNRCDTGFWYPSDTFTVWYYGGTFVARMCGNHTPSIVSPAPPRVAGRIWHDYNANGVVDAGEPGLSGWGVYLNRDATRVFNGSANVNGDYNIAVDARSGMTPNAGYYTGPVSVPAGWVVTKYPNGAWIGEGSGSAGATWGGMNIGVRQIVPPITSIIPSATAPTGNNGWYKTPTTFSFSVNEPATTRYSIDGTGTPATVWSSGSVAVAEGTHVVRYRSVDTVGDVENEKAYTFKVDVTAPSTPTVSWMAWGLGWGRISWSASSDAVSGLSEYQLVDLDTGSTISTSAAGQAVVLGALDPQKTYRMAVIAVDVAGNQSISDPLEFVIDNRAPVSTLHVDKAVPDGFSGWYVTDPSAWVTADETATCYLGINGPEQVSTAPVALGEGVHGLVYHSVDEAGNIEATRSATVKVDLTGPVTSSDAVARFFDAASIKITAADSVSGVSAIEYRVDGGAWTPGDVVNVTGYGNHWLEARATDVAGNVGSTARADFSIVYSDTLPPITAALGDVTSWVTRAAHVSLDATDVAGPGEVVSGVATTCVCVDGATADLNALDFPVDGVYVLEFRSTDYAGNAEATKTATVRVDTTAPVTTSDVRPFYTKTATVTFASTDNLSGVAATYYRWDGGAWANGVAATTTKAGVRTLEFYSVDVAGNAEAPRTVTFSVTMPPPPPPPADVTPPVTIIAGIPSGWVNVDVTATLSATDDMSGVDKTWYVPGSGAQTEYASGVTITSEGITTIGYWSADKAGNVEARNDAQVRIDKTAPTVPGAPAYSSLTTNTVTLAWNASTDALSGVARYELYDGAVLVAAVTECRAALTVEPGSQHSYTVRAVDVAGNVSAFSAIGVVSVPIDGGGGSVGQGTSVTTTIGVPVYYENVDRDHHQNGDGDAVIETASVTIEYVTKPGTLTVVWSENPPKAAPATFMFANEYYDVSFTGTYAGKIIVTLPYDPRWPDDKARNFMLKHWVNGAWENVPVTVDLVNHTVTGVVNSLSPFAHAFAAGTDLSTRLLPARWVAPYAGKPVTLSARLVDASGTALPGFTVVLQRYRAGAWSTVATASPVTGSPGSYSATDTPAKMGVTRYRFRFAGELFDGSTSLPIPVLTRAVVGSGVTPGVGSAKFTARIAPPHGYVYVYVQRKVGRTYRSAVVLRVKVATGRGAAMTKLSRGAYRYRAVHLDTSHARSVTTWKAFAVR